MFEPFDERGATVEEGAQAGVVHFLDDPARPPVPAHYRSTGILISRRQPGRVERGNCVAVIGVDCGDG